MPGIRRQFRCSKTVAELEPAFLEGRQSEKKIRGEVRSLEEFAGAQDIKLQYDSKVHEVARIMAKD